ncbi:TPA: fimbria/pilus periplasmic chaperone [Photobacterium damselae]
MKNKIKYSMVLLLSLIFSQQVMAALVLDATRYIYNGKDDSISVLVENESQHEYGAQIWIENIIENDSRPMFVGTPSFFKVKPDRHQVARIIKVSNHMAQDKESIYWLNVQEIPPLKEGGGLSIAIRTRVKLIYRPMALIKDRNNAEQYISIKKQSGKSYLVNTTPYIFTIGTVLDINDRPIKFSRNDITKLTMFMPGDKVELRTNEVKSVNALNDYGNMQLYRLKSPLSTSVKKL